MLDEIRSNLWSDSITPNSYTASNESYNTTVLEQYKLYVSLADQVSSRRGATNTFFLTLNTAVFALVGALIQSHVRASWLLVMPLAGLLGQCIAWFWLVRSYRQLNSAKFTVIGALEERLPASPWWRAEWRVLGEGRDMSRYWPLTHLEQWIPTLFAIVYIAVFVALVLT